jgi:hypothetical protein
MLHAAQPWLPLFEGDPPPGPSSDKPRRGGRRVAFGASSTPAASVPFPSRTSCTDPRQARALRWAFLGIARSWTLSGSEALALLGEPWSDEAERLERMHALLGAHHSLLLLAPGRVSELVRAPTPLLEGASPLEVLLRDGLPGTARVRAHLVAMLRP